MVPCQKIDSFHLGLISQHKSRFLVIVSLIFLLGAGIRLYNIQKPFVGLLPVREFRSAIIARNFYFASNPEISTWEQEVAQISRDREWSLEPPILEWITAVTFRLIGREQLWIPRLYATLFWMVSAFIFWRIVRHMYGDETAVFLIAYYLFLPIGVIASKSFQPDTLMMMFYLASLWAILRYDQEPTGRHFLWIMLASGLAILIRPLCLFAIYSAFTTLMVYRIIRRQRRSLFHVVQLNLVLLLVVAYYAYGFLIADSLTGQTNLTFQPHLLLQRDFWKDWIFLGLDTLSITGILLALLGLALLNSPRLQWLIIGLWGSYFIYGVIFNYHISTHSYYHILLIPTIAFSAGPLISNLVTRMRELNRSWLRFVWVGVVLTIFISLAMWQVVQQGRRTPNFEDQVVAQEIGKLVNHSTNTVYLSPYYGRPLEYLGQLSGQYWPRPIAYAGYRHPVKKDLSIADRLAEIPFTPDYFIITDFREYNSHHNDLKEYLYNHCLPLAESDHYLIYHACD